MSIEAFRKITTIFFDLDHTLFDYDTAKERAVVASFAPALARQDKIPFETLRANYDVAMQMASADGKMWGVSYLTPDRFRDTLRLSGIEIDDLVDEMAETYWRVFHGQPATFDDAEETLGALKGRFRLGMITNGHAGPQRKTIELSGLASYFEEDLLIVSGEVGFHKPEPGLYMEAMLRAESTPEESLMVGDNPVNDIDGAVNAGLRTAWLARNGETYPEDLRRPDVTITSLLQLIPMLENDK